MPILAVVFAVMAALIHVYFFVLESLWFMRPRVYRRFGLRTDEEAETVRNFAYNQGFYNLFLAAGVAIGLALALPANGDLGAGRAIVYFSCASMVAAGAVLLRFNPRGAMLQATPPLLAIAASMLQASPAG
jgi:putative membrane protein